MNARLGFSVLAILLLVAAATLVVRSAPQVPTNQLSQDEALLTIRTVNTGEFDFSLRKGGYASLGDLYGNGDLAELETTPVLLDGVSARIKDYRLSVIKSSDGKRYLVTLVPEKGCGLALASSEVGVIFAGKALGCPAL